MPDSASFRIPTIWLSLNFDLRMTTPELTLVTSNQRVHVRASPRCDHALFSVLQAQREGFFRLGDPQSAMCASIS
jgi:hypothetical protein